MGRKLAYAFVAALGYVLGVFLYFVAWLAYPLMPQLFEILARLNLPRQVVEAMISGFVGAVIAVVAAYYWASRSPEIV